MNALRVELCHSKSRSVVKAPKVGIPHQKPGLFTSPQLTVNSTSLKKHQRLVMGTNQKLISPAIDTDVAQGVLKLYICGRLHCSNNFCVVAKVPCATSLHLCCHGKKKTIIK